MRIYIGFDDRDYLAFQVCRDSLLKHATIDVEIIPLKVADLRERIVYWREYRVDGAGQMWDDRDNRPFSTQFSFTRFAVPVVEDWGNDWVMFMDADMMWRDDIKNLVDLIDIDKAVMCVKHNQEVKETNKMDGVIQNPNTHGRKNWSSLMLMKPSRCTDMTKYALNNMTGEWLHSMVWVPDDLIGEFPEEWNYLVGYTDPKKDAKIVHFTLGDPSMIDDVEYEDEWWSYADKYKDYVI